MTIPDLANEGVEGKFTSRRIFLPPPKAPRRVEIYFDLLNSLGLDDTAQPLAFSRLELSGRENVLHAGCGEGLLTLEIKRRWPELEIEGVDPDERALNSAGEQAEENGQHVLFEKGYLQDLPSTAERYDLIVCVLHLYRLFGYERSEAFEEFRRVLKPGGRLLLVDFGSKAGGVRGWLVRRLAAHFPGLTEQLNLGLPEIAKLGGFTQVQLFEENRFGLQAVRCERP